MILLHRISSFGVAFIVAGGFAFLIGGGTHPALAIPSTTILAAFVLSRLLGWHARTFQFWHLLGTPLLFLLSTFGMLLLLESRSTQAVLATLAVCLIFLFVEHVFSFVHLPVRYQPFTLEHFSQLLHVLSVFFFATLLFGLQLFLHAPLWLLCLTFFPLLVFIVYGTLWAGKVDAARAWPYALSGAALLTELFAALAFLPTGFYTNAAFLALGVYVLLGLSRADALHKLSAQVVRRYVVLFFVLASLIAATSQWV